MAKVVLGKSACSSLGTRKYFPQASPKMTTVLLPSGMMHEDTTSPLTWHVTFAYLVPPWFPRVLRGQMMWQHMLVAQREQNSPAR